jgi:hypothetical protein
MKTPTSALVIVAALCGAHATLDHAVAQDNSEINFNFDNDEVGKLPADWTPVVSNWVIALDGSNKAMKQAGKSEGDRFNICVQSKLKYVNLEMEVRIKPLEGEEDQGGGLVWRYQDAKNYYITRANPLENNFRVYKVVNGNRKQMQSANVKMQKGEWYRIKVVITGNNMDCYYNGQKLLSHTDDTFPNAGLVGFWSKADAVSLFDDLKIKSHK